MFPLAVGLGALAPTIVKTLLRPEWAGVAPMLTILSALSVARPFGFTVSSYLQASNRPRAAMWLFLSKVVLLVACIVGFGQLGPLWACAGVGVAFALQSLMALGFVAKVDGIALGALVWRTVPPLVACVPMAAAVTATRLAIARAGWTRAACRWRARSRWARPSTSSRRSSSRPARRAILLSVVRDASHRRRASGAPASAPSP